MVQTLSLAFNELECEILGTQIETLCTRFTRATPSIIQVKRVEGYVYVSIHFLDSFLVLGQALSMLTEPRNGKQLLSLKTVDTEQILEDLLRFQSPSDPDNTSIGYEIPPNPLS